MAGLLRATTAVRRSAVAAPATARAALATARPTAVSAATTDSAVAAAAAAAATAGAAGRGSRRAMLPRSASSSSSSSSSSSMRGLHRRRDYHHHALGTTRPAAAAPGGGGRGRGDGDGEGGGDGGEVEPQQVLREMQLEQEREAAGGDRASAAAAAGLAAAREVLADQQQRSGGGGGLTASEEEVDAMVSAAYEAARLKNDPENRFPPPNRANWDQDPMLSHPELSWAPPTAPLGGDGDGEHPQDPTTAAAAAAAAAAASTEPELWPEDHETQRGAVHGRAEPLFAARPGRGPAPPPPPGAAVASLSGSGGPARDALEAEASQLANPDMQAALRELSGSVSDTLQSPAEFTAAVRAQRPVGAAANRRKKQIPLPTKEGARAAEPGATPGRLAEADLVQVMLELQLAAEASEDGTVPEEDIARLARPLGLNPTHLGLALKHTRVPTEFTATAGSTTCLRNETIIPSTGTDRKQQ